MHGEVGAKEPRERATERKGERRAENWKAQCRNRRQTQSANPAPKAHSRNWQKPNRDRETETIEPIEPQAADLSRDEPDDICVFAEALETKDFAIGVQIVQNRLIVPLSRRKQQTERADEAKDRKFFLEVTEVGAQAKSHERYTQRHT